MCAPDFDLASTESYEMEEPRQCWRVRRMETEKRDDLLLVKIDPPLIGQKYGLGARDPDLVLIATRHRDESLFPIATWPVYVHVALPLIADRQVHDKLKDSQIQSIAWATLYQTADDARLKRT